MKRLSKVQRSSSLGKALRKDFRQDKPGESGMKMSIYLNGKDWTCFLLITKGFPINIKIDLITLLIMHAPTHPWLALCLSIKALIPRFSENNTRPQQRTAHSACETNCRDGSANTSALHSYGSRIPTPGLSNCGAGRGFVDDQHASARSAIESNRNFCSQSV